jgi:hypothetical protein
MVKVNEDAIAGAAIKLKLTPQHHGKQNIKDLLFHPEISGSLISAKAIYTFSPFSE